MMRNKERKPGYAQCWTVLEGTPLGPIYMARSEMGLCRAAFGQSVFLFAQAMKGLPRQDDSFADGAAQVAAYFAHERLDFELPLDLRGCTPFQQAVLRAVCEVPAGTVRHYSDIAGLVGRPAAYRAVGAANGSNPLPLFVPCHRLVGSDGRLRGYGSGQGVATKRWLLDWEGVDVSVLRD